MYEADFQASKESTNSQLNMIRRVYQSPGWIVTIALILRLVVALSFVEDQLSPERDHYRFGWETGRIARSVALGEGFSSPFHAPTGPTAWLAPVYVYLVAAVFKVFGVYTFKSAVVTLTLNSIFSALTCLTVFFIAHKSFGRVIAVRAGWMWALFPYAIDFAARRVWGDCLNTLLFSLLFLAALRLEDLTSRRAWLGFGLLAGITVLTCPPILLVALLLIARICYRNRRHGKSWALPAGLAALMMLLVVSPWFVRNYQTFDRFIPFRSNFWFEMRVGNTGDLSDNIPDWAHPSTSKAEMEEYRRLGELDYMASKRRQTIDFISAYPDAFVSLTVRRFFCVWTGFWSLQIFHADPILILHVILTTILTIFMLAGLFKAWRSDRALIMPYLLALFAFPLIYYITHSHAEYRHPIDTIIVVLVVYGASGFVRRRVETSQQLAAADVSASHNSSKNTCSHSRAKAPLAPPAARKAISALSLIAFTLAYRYFFLALSIRSTFSVRRMANSSRMAAISTYLASKAVSCGTEISRATACLSSSGMTGLMR
jgi:4-amino-4-deoxy-L-arabinose transferase-like glycosyltransferase